MSPNILCRREVTGGQVLALAANVGYNHGQHLFVNVDSRYLARHRLQSFVLAGSSTRMSSKTILVFTREYFLSRSPHTRMRGLAVRG